METHGANFPGLARMPVWMSTRQGFAAPIHAVSTGKKSSTPRIGKALPSRRLSLHAPHLRLATPPATASASLDSPSPRRTRSTHPSTRFTLGMEEDQEHGGEPPAQDPTPVVGSSSGGGKKGSPCEECGEQPWKYRCPGCSRLTCSLPCVQSHKRRTACTGKRPRTDPVRLSQFDDNQLLSDYNFLEETKQVRESAHRLIGGFGRNFGGVQLPKWLFFLHKVAQWRGIRLDFLPRGMTRREQNRSRHNHRKDCIY